MRPCIIETVVDGRSVLHLSGELDVASRRQLVEACHRVRERQAQMRVVVDLSHVDFIDGASLGELARTVRDRHVLGDPCVTVARTAFLRRLLDITGYSVGTTVVSDLPTALAVLRDGRSPDGGRQAAG